MRPQVAAFSWGTRLTQIQHCRLQTSRSTCTLILRGKSRVLPRKSSIAKLSMADTAATTKIALLQIVVGDDKQKNLKNAREALEEGAKNGAQLAMLPECFNCPYDTAAFPEYAESVADVGEAADKSGPSVSMLQEMAKEFKLYIVGGSIPERSADKIYNTSVSVGPTGEILAKHRKVHLFDIDVPGKIQFKESETLSAGNQPTIFGAGDLKVGVAICYDVRFPELSLLMAKKGVQLLCVPGAFNTTTGPAHWELLLRARALDNQFYVAACSPARNENASYQAWGHSTVCNPWGEVIATTEHEKDIVYADIDLNELNNVRKFIPTSKQQRNDLYELRTV